MATQVRTEPVASARWHRAWLVAAVTLGALVAAAAFRSSIGLLLEPIEAEFGWSRALTSGAVTLNLVLYGVVAPFAAALMELWGIRRVICLALALVAGATALTLVMTQPWQLYLLWGLLVGTGTGAMALVFGAIIANRWFVTKRGLVTGIFSAGNATGQLLFLPLVARAVDGPGWRYAAGGVAVFATVMLVLVSLFIDDRPSDRGLLPYGAVKQAEKAAPVAPSPEMSPPEMSPPEMSSSGGAAAAAVRRALDSLATASRTWVFWVLAFTFFVCGWSTNGLVQTHFVPAAHDHGMATTTAAGLLAVVGVFDIVGTLASGWLSDWADSRVLLAAYYGLRGLSLLALQQMLAPDVRPSLWVFIVFYGLDWVATVPPTVALCRQHFGLEASGVVFGWVYAAHMIGAGIGASAAGWIRTSSGSYQVAWLVAAALCLVAAASVFTIRRREPAS
jgi:predicted MFS family arabinose efflux permease